MEMFKPPCAMNFTAGNVAENWKKWHQKFINFLIASEKSEKSEETKIAILLNLLGDEGVSIFNTFKFHEVADSKKFEKVIQKFEEHCIPRKNIVFERYKFFTCSQLEGQTVDAYLTVLKTLASTCEFGDQESSLIRDRIVLGILDKSVQERLLRESKLTLEKATEFVRASEVTKEQIKTIADPQGKSDVDAVKIRRNRQCGAQVQRFQSSKSGVSSKSGMFNCNKCGRSHKKRECPAFNKLCNSCKGKNHFAAMCTSASQKAFKKRQVNEIHNTDCSQEMSSLFIDTLSSNQMSSETVWCKDISIYDKLINFKLDTGAEANIIPLKLYNNLKLCDCSKLNRTKIALISYSNHKLIPEGEVSLLCSTEKSKNVQLNFIIVNVDSKPILGLNACKMLNLIQRIDSIEIASKMHVLSKYNELFKGLGKFPGDPYHIELKEIVLPVIDPPRRVPQAIITELKDTLVDLEARGIISQVNKPTDWVNSLIVVEKPNGKLRICLDPRNLNKAIKREHHIIPSSDEIISRLKGNEYFTVLDLKEGFWQVPLDEESSELCTFNSPFGRYKFNVLPFGIASAPEVFQKRSQKLFSDIQGVEIYFDDFIVSGKTKAEHDKNLIKVLERAKANNVKFNPDKLQFRVREVKYMGLIISAEGVKADISHVRAINELDQPTNKKDIRRFLGMINFLSKFIPNVSKITAPLRELLKNNVEFHWSWEQKQAFDNIKSLISSAPVLKVFDSSKEITIQCDSSKDGIGICLLQEGHPVSFASRSLTETEKNYAQIEKELLAIVFAFQKFHNFVYGHKVVVQSDHKPLTAIVEKPISKISNRLQKMLLKLLKYSFQVRYLPGKDMYLADTLSRAFIRDPVKDDPEMLQTVHAIAKYMPMSIRRIEQFRKAIGEDDELKEVVNYCKEGWPDKKKIKKELTKYYKLQNDLLIIEGLLFLNDKVIVPKALRLEMLSLIHESHLGIEKSKNRAREIMFWPGLSQDIENMIQKCEICIKFRKTQSNEPLFPHSIPERPFQKIAVDLMFFKGVNYVVITDYFSKWIEVEKVNNKTVGDIIVVLENTFARFGVPETIVCDNNPFNSYEFKKFAKQWDMEISFISPYHSQSNGRAEKAVGIVKALFKKASEDNKRPVVALIEYRNSPITGIGLSPAQMLFNRRLRTKLPISKKLLTPKIAKDILPRLKQQQNKQKFYFDRNVKQLKPLKAGDKVFVQNMKFKTWEPAIILSKANTPRSYKIKTNSGSIYYRNRKYLTLSKVDKSYNECVNLDCEIHDYSQDQCSNDCSTNDNNGQTSTSANSDNEACFKTKSGRICKRPAYLSDYAE